MIVNHLRSEDRVTTADAAAVDSVCRFATFQQNQCLLFKGLEARAPGCKDDFTTHYS